MVPVLIAGLLAMVAAVVIGPKFIEVLRTRNLGQQIRAEGPAAHVVKQGTPTMGGLLIIASAVFPFLALSQYTDRVRRRLPEAPAPPFARPVRAMEDGAPRRRHPRGRAAPPGE